MEHRIVIKRTVENALPEGFPDSEMKDCQSYWDKASGIAVLRCTLPMKLTVGELYDFIYKDEEEDECGVYTRLVLREDEGNVYYLVEYYNHRPYAINESALAGDKWIKCDIQKELGIDVVNARYIPKPVSCSATAPLSMDELAELERQVSAKVSAIGKERMIAHKAYMEGLEQGVDMMFKALRIHVRDNS